MGGREGGWHGSAFLTRKEGTRGGGSRSQGETLRIWMASHYLGVGSLFYYFFHRNQLRGDWLPLDSRTPPHEKSA